jgi:hypothetical protein
LTAASSDSAEQRGATTQHQIAQLLTSHQSADKIFIMASFFPNAPRLQNGNSAEAAELSGMALVSINNPTFIFQLEGELTT